MSEPVHTQAVQAASRDRAGIGLASGDCSLLAAAAVCVVPRVIGDKEPGRIPGRGGYMRRSR